MTVIQHNGQIYHTGWAGPEAARRSWDVFGPYMAEFRIIGGEPSAGKRAVLWEHMKKATGKYLINIKQEIGDCVSWGARNAVDHTAAVQIALGKRELFRGAFAPYIYGCARVLVDGQHDRQDGSTGTAGAEALKRYGVCPFDYEGVPAYSGRVASDWGYSGPPQKFVDFGSTHRVKTAARITSYEQLRDAICNGYACSIANGVGYSMRLQDQGGKSWFTGRDSWNHQMSIIGIDDNPQAPACFRLNSWGPDAHGPQLDGPPGGGWCHAEDIDRQLRSGDTECFAYSEFDGFPAQAIDWSSIF